MTRASLLPLLVALAATGPVHAADACGPDAPQSLFPDTAATPQFADFTDGVPYNLGVYFVPKVNGRLVALRYWKAPSEPAVDHRGFLWDASTGRALTQTLFRNETASGWQQARFGGPGVRLQAGRVYVATVDVQSHYVSTYGVFDNDVARCDLVAPGTDANGAFGPALFFPTQSYKRSSYWRDVVFFPTEALDSIGAGFDRNSPPGAYVDEFGFSDPGTGSPGTTLATDQPVDRGDAVAPAAAAVYQRARIGAPAIDYLLTGTTVDQVPIYTPGARYRVRLHFAEIAPIQAGERRFHVLLNGQPVLNDFDIVQAAGGTHRVVIREFDVVAANQRGTGFIRIQFNAGAASVPLVSAIEVLPIE